VLSPQEACRAASAGTARAATAETDDPSTAFHPIYSEAESGFGLGRLAAKLTSVWQLRHWNMSKSALSALDLLASMATPQIGQCRKDRGVEAIAPRPSSPPA
jgi:hypothetical protein